MTSSVSQVVGILAGAETVKQATITLLSAPPTDVNGEVAGSPLIVYYLAEVERQAGLRPGTLPTPPAPDSYYGGVDFESWNEDLLPSIIVVVDPIDEPAPFGDGTIGHWFEMQIGVVVQADSEDAAQMIASHYGTAIMGAVLQSGDLGGVANGTELTLAAKVELLEDEENRLFAKSVLTVRTYLDQIVARFIGPAGPVSWPTDPYTPPPDWPTAETVTIDIEVMDAGADTADATFTGNDVIDITVE